MEVEEGTRAEDSKPADRSGDPRRSRAAWLTSMGAMALGLSIVMAVLMLIGVAAEGTKWVDDEVLPLVTLACMGALAINVVVFVPLAMAKGTRQCAGLGFFVSSYIFGLIAWFVGLVLTWNLWGTWAVVLGLCLAGVGCVPFGMLAALMAGWWLNLGVMALALVMTLALQGLGMSILEHHSHEEEEAAGD